MSIIEPGRLSKVFSQPIAITSSRCKVNRLGTPDSFFFKVSGLTSKYNVSLKNTLFDCTCLDQQMRGGRCKHILYILIFYFKLSIDDPLLKQIHYSAKDKITLYSSSKKDFVQAGSVERKPDMECSICISKITKKQKSDWCKWSCGMNFHETCITRWLRIQQTQKSDLTCPMCRQLWNEHK